MSKLKVVKLSQITTHIKDLEGCLRRAIGSAERAEVIDLQGRSVSDYSQWLLSLESLHHTLYKHIATKGITDSYALTGTETNETESGKDSGRGGSQ